MTTTAYESWGTDIIGIRNTEGKVFVSDNLADLLHFMRYSAKQTLRVSWDLDELVAPIIRKFSRSDLDRLAKNDGSLIVEGNEVYYYAGGMFRCGMSRYYGVKQFLNIPGFPPTPSLEEVQEQADEILATLDELGMGNPRKLTSLGAVFEDTDMGKELMSKLPKSHDLNPSCDEAVQFASLADRKDWVANYAIGFYKAGEAHDFDMTACYLSLAAKLFDLRDCEFWKSDKMGKRESRALYGLVKGQFYIDPDGEYAHASPIIAEAGNGLRGNPVGLLPKDTYSLEEVRTVENKGIGEFTFKEGWFINPLGGVRPRQSYKEIMEYIYNKRAWSPMASVLMKALGNILVGKMIERERVDGLTGAFRNDIYHALITAGARCEITKFLVNNEVKADELLAVQTDGVRLTKSIPMPRHNGMGTWRQNEDADLLIVSPVKIYTNDKRPYRTTLADIQAMIAEHPSIERYGKKVLHRTTLQQAMEAGDLYSVGQLKNIPATFDLIRLDGEQTRRFPELPKIGRDLLGGQYQSEPILVEGD